MYILMFKEIFSKSKRLYAVMRPYRLQFWTGVLISSALGLLQAILYAYMFGNATQAIIKGDGALVLLVLTKSIIFFLLITLLNAFSGYLLDVANAKATADLRAGVFEKLLMVPLEASVNEHSGIKLSYLMNDVPTALSSLRDSFILPLSCVISGIGGLYYLVRLDSRLALLVLFMGLFSFLYSTFFAKNMRLAGDKVQHALGVSGSRLKDLLDGMITVRIFMLNKKFQDQYDASAEEAMQAGVARSWMSGFLGGFNNFNHHFGSIIVMFVAGQLVFCNSLSLPNLMRASQMAGEVLGIFSFARLVAEVQGALAGAQRVFNVIDRPNEALGEDFATETSFEAVRFDNVMFSYNPEQHVLLNASFTIKAGEMVAFIGESGCGKSSVLRLIQGLYRPSGGKIDILGLDISKWKSSFLRQNIAFVPQDAPLFTGTISENIAIGKPGATQEEIREAAIAANAISFIDALPGGLQARITERGASLSGGQRQRIAIARALLKNAPILLLDEATSALDGESEACVQQTFESLKGKCTVLVVAHRLSTVNIADRVLKMKIGGEVESV